MPWSIFHGNWVSSVLILQKNGIQPRIGVYIFDLKKKKFNQETSELDKINKREIKSTLLFDISVFPAIMSNSQN